MCPYVAAMCSGVDFWTETIENGSKVEYLASGNLLVLTIQVDVLLLHQELNHLCKHTCVLKTNKYADD